MEKYSFHYRTLDEIKAKIDELGIELPMSCDVSVLSRPIVLNGQTIRNRLGIAPLEGVDSLPEGSPSELTQRRYLRFARGGAGTIWFEAVSVVQEGRSSLKQLLLTKENVDDYKRLNDRIKEEGLKANGFAPYLVMQANHSGRYSRPNAATLPEPIVAFNDPYLEKNGPLSSEHIATDEYLHRMEDAFGEAAFLARDAGFDAYDVKSCHGYLFAEIAAAHTRTGLYGGSFENRMRLMKNAVKSAQAAQTREFKIVARVGVYDNIPYPYGFGMKTDGTLVMDMDEPIRMIRMLHEELGMEYLNVTIGDPHYDAYVTRPFNLDIKYMANEEPLLGVARLFRAACEIKKNFPKLVVSASGPSYLRQFSAQAVAGAVEQGWFDQALFGRMAFANPDFANDIIKNGELKSNRVCLTCSKCSELIRAGVPVGCVIRDTGEYLPYYQALHQG